MTDLDVKALKSLLEKSYVENAKTISNSLGSFEKSLDKLEIAIASMELKLSEMRSEVGYMKENYNRLDRAQHEHITEYRSNVSPNISTWNGTAESQKWVVRTIIGLIIAALFVGLGIKM